MIEFILGFVFGVIAMSTGIYAGYQFSMRIARDIANTAVGKRNAFQSASATGPAKSKTVFMPKMSNTEKKRSEENSVEKVKDGIYMPEEDHE